MTGFGLVSPSTCTTALTLRLSKGAAQRLPQVCAAWFEGLTMRSLQHSVVAEIRYFRP